MNEQALIRKMQQARERVLELPNGKRVTLRMPLQTQYFRVFKLPPEELVAQLVVGWDGVTEADLLGDGVGASDAVPFSAEVAVQWLCEQPGCVSLIISKALEVVNSKTRQTAEDEKN